MRRAPDRPLHDPWFGRRWLVALLVVALFGGWSAAQETEESGDEGPATGAAELVDRIVAIVDDDPILESDIDRTIGLGLLERGPEEDQQAFRRRVLDRLIDQKLHFHEIDQFGFAALPLEEIDEKYEAIRSGFAGEAEFRQRLEQLGITDEDLRQLVARQLMVLTYVDERLGPRIFVALDDIELYYREVFEPELRSRGMAVPPVADVREDIRALIRERRLNEEIERWTEELRLDADVEDFFDSEHEELPPVVSRRDQDGE